MYQQEIVREYGDRPLTFRLGSATRTAQRVPSFDLGESPCIPTGDLISYKVRLIALLPDPLLGAKQ